MRYRVTCLTPVLVGDGGRLSPIDYMVWKDQVNVLDQTRIFRLLARGPRLDGYLAQLKRAERLDFASWGGFAQNFAGRRIPFEHPSLTAHWERARDESLNIPTFASGTRGPYLPGSALRGALRTGMVFAGLKEGALERVASLYGGDRPPRRPAEALEERALGGRDSNRMRAVRASDSDPISPSCLKVYLLRVASLRARGRGDSFELGWKQSPKGTAEGTRPSDGTPLFAEMAAPGTVFEGVWNEVEYFRQPDVMRALNWRGPLTREALFEAANRYAAAQLEAHQRYVESTTLPLVRQSLRELQDHMASIREGGRACLLCLGWGGGVVAHVAWPNTDDPAYRAIIVQGKLFRSVYPGFPFPKTRRIVFLEDRPATLPGWVLFEVVE
ncbi:MAG: type III-A CRISPR-associated RAMP protein Csm5 [Bryobacteraceae bacterium]